MRLRYLSHFVLLSETTVEISALQHRHHHHHHRPLKEVRRQKDEECIKPLHFYVLELQKNVSAIARTETPRGQTEREVDVEDGAEEEWSISFRLVDLDTGVDTRCSRTWNVSSSSSCSLSTLNDSAVSTPQREAKQDVILDTDENDPLENEEEQHRQHAAQLGVLLVSTVERQDCGNVNVGFCLDDFMGLTIVEAACLGLSSGPVKSTGSIPHDSLKLECAHGDGQEGASTICRSSEQVLVGLFESPSPAPPLLAP